MLNHKKIPIDKINELKYKYGIHFKKTYSISINSHFLTNVTETPDHPRKYTSNVRNRGHASLRRIPDLYMPHDTSSWSATEPTTLPKSPTCWTPPPEGVDRATSSHLMLRYWRHRSPKLLRRNPSMVAMATNFPYRRYLEWTN